MCLVNNIMPGTPRRTRTPPRSPPRLPGNPLKQVLEDLKLKINVLEQENSSLVRANVELEIRISKMQRCPHELHKCNEEKRRLERELSTHKADAQHVRDKAISQCSKMLSAPPVEKSSSKRRKRKRTKKGRKKKHT